MASSLLRSCLLGCFTLLLLGRAALAQDDATQARSVYVRAGIGVSFYGGDRSQNPENALRKYLEDTGGGFSLEVGYNLTNRLSLGLMHISGQYPKINTKQSSSNFPLLDEATSSDWRHHFSLIGRSLVWPEKRLSPYGLVGVNASFGEVNGGRRVGFGPVMGVGMDLRITDQVGLFLALNGLGVFPDDALDLSDPGNSADLSAFDAFLFFSAGVRYTRTRARSPIPVAVQALDCAGEGMLLSNEPGIFTAMINAEAPQPVELMWDFGNGNTATGLVATQAYQNPGTYTVTFIASNQSSTATATCSILVPVPAQIIASTADQKTVDTCTATRPVNFSADVRGQGPLAYRWDFGDGTLGTEANPSHKYTTEGAYTVTLTLSNVVGADTSALLLTVGACCDAVVLREVFFEHNTAVPTEVGRQFLEENAEALLQCQRLHVQVVGQALPNERNPRQLSEERARVIEAFYRDQGIEATRIKRQDGF